MPQRRRDTQKTPQGKEIPVPKRKDFLGNLKRVARDQVVKRTSSTKK
jgi:hypothetical protein